MIRVFHKLGDANVRIGPPPAKYDWFSVTWLWQDVHAVLMGQTVCSSEGTPAGGHQYEMELYVDGVRIANSGIRGSASHVAPDDFVPLHCFGYAKIRFGSVLLMKVETVVESALMYANKTDLAVIW